MIAINKRRAHVPLQSYTADEQAFEHFRLRSGAAVRPPQPLDRALGGVSIAAASLMPPGHRNPTAAACAAAAALALPLSACSLSALARNPCHPRLGSGLHQPPRAEPEWRRLAVQAVRPSRGGAAGLPCRRLRHRRLGAGAVGWPRVDMGACVSWAEDQGSRWGGRSLQSMPGRHVAGGGMLPRAASPSLPPSANTGPAADPRARQLGVPGPRAPALHQLRLPLPGWAAGLGSTAVDVGIRLMAVSAAVLPKGRGCCRHRRRCSCCAPHPTAAATSDPCRLHALRPCHPHTVNPPFVPEDNPTGCYQLAFDAPAEAAGQGCGSGGCWSAPRLYGPARGAATLPPLGQRRAAAAACLPQACPPSSVSPLHLSAHTPAARSAALVFEGVDSAFYCWLNGQVRGRFCCGGYLRRAEPAGWGPGGPMRAPHLQALEPACPAGDCS